MLEWLSRPEDVRGSYLITAMFTGAVVVARNTLLSAIVTIDKIIERGLFGERN